MPILTSSHQGKSNYAQTTIFLKGPHKFLIYPIDIDEKTTVCSILNEMKNIIKDDKKYEIVWPERDASNRIKEVHSLFGDEKIFKYARKKTNNSTKLQDLMNRCDLWMVSSDSFYQTRIFFNPYIKLVLGIPCGYLDLYPNMEKDTVADLERLIKMSLQIGVDDDRFALYGFNNPEMNLKVKSLSKGDHLSFLQKEYESSVVEKFHFWQYMVRPEIEGSLNLGVERETTLRIQNVDDYRKHLPYRTMAKVRVTQQGTTLFIWDGKVDDDNGHGKRNLLMKIENIHKCQFKNVINGEDQTFGIEIKSLYGINYLFSKQKNRIVRWMIHLRKATPSSEILEPVWMGIGDDAILLEEDKNNALKNVALASTKEGSKSIFGKMFKNSNKTQETPSTGKSNRLLNSLWNKVSRSGPDEKGRIKKIKEEVEEAQDEYDIAAGIPSSPSPDLFEVQTQPPLTNQKPISPRPLLNRPTPPVQRSDFLASLPSSTIILGSTDAIHDKKKRNTKKVTFQINEWDDWRDQITNLEQMNANKSVDDCDEIMAKDEGIMAKIDPTLLNALKSNPSLKSLISEMQ